jgi:hypothetical protein
MEKLLSRVGVLGVGHLAAAVRMQLRLARHVLECVYGRARGGCACGEEPAGTAPAFFLACSDFENAALTAALGRWVVRDRASILFACLSGNALRVGPFVSSPGIENVSGPYLTRSWDFSLRHSQHTFVPPHLRMTPNTDTSLTRVAQIGGSLVVGELANLPLFNAWETRFVDPVAENESPLFWERHSEGDMSSSAGVGLQTFVVSGARQRNGWNRIAHPWHPLGLG